MRPDDWITMSGFCVIAATILAVVGFTGSRPWWVAYLAALAYATAAVVFGILALATL